MSELYGRRRVQLLIGFAIGIAFGFLLQRGGATSYDVVVGQLLLRDFTVAKIILSAIATGVVGVYLLRWFGLVTVHPKPCHLRRIGLGGLTFGVGFALLGYCPGTAAGAFGAGSLHALAGMLGILLGAGIFASLYPDILRLLPDEDYGKVTIPELLDVNPWVVIVPVVAAILSALWLLEGCAARDGATDNLLFRLTVSIPMAFRRRALYALLLACIMTGGMISGSALHAQHLDVERQADGGLDGKAAELPRWADGSFNGTIYRGGEAAGAASGFVKLGRTSQRGWFTGTWRTDDRQGEVAGFFFGPLLLGQFNASGSPGTMPLVGVLQSNASCFTARLLSPPGLQVSGGRRASFLPAPGGAYDIGTTTMHLVDHERGEPFTDDPSDNREVMLQVWYPAAAGSHDERAAYMDPETFDWLKHEAPIPLFWIPDDAYSFVQPHAVRDAPPAGQRFPVLLFSHGYDGVREIYTSLIETLVSHGYVVAAVQHPYVAGVTVFPDGRVVEHQPAPSDPDEAEGYFQMAFDAVVGDIAFVLDVLPTMEPPLRACFNLSRVGIYGHSFGGGASAAICNQDERVLAGTALDGYFQGEVVKNGLQQPFLSLLAEGHFKRDASLRQLWNRTHSDIYMATVAGAAHYSYTDVGLLLTHVAPLIPRQAVGFGSIEPKHLIEITNAFTLAFFDVYLKDAPLDELLDLAGEYPEVSFDYK